MDEVILKGLISGTITMHTFILKMLDEEGILSREKSLSYLKMALSGVSEEAKATRSSLPLEMVIRNLETPEPSPGSSSPPWTPVVIPGGKE